MQIHFPDRGLMSAVGRSQSPLSHFSGGCSFWTGNRLTLLAMCVMALCPLHVSAQQTNNPAGAKNSVGLQVTRIDERFAHGGTTEVPQFRQHVVPLLGKLGCNGRACHGSFQGQGDFRLSLFGYDFAEDHKGLLAGEPARVNKTNPDASPMLTKPTLTEPHEGGRRLEVGTWQYRVLQQWIQRGAAPVSAQTPEFVELRIEPSEILARQVGDTQQLRAVVTWSDGSSEDVTPLCRFQSNNDDIAKVNEAGLVTIAGPGDSHIVTFYDNGVVPVPVILPISSQSGDNDPQTEALTQIDRLVLGKLRKIGVQQSDLCTDSEFLRRVSLDITGTLPTVREVDEFLNDSSKNKREHKIAELLERPAYAAWWATRLSDITGNNATYLNKTKGISARLASEEWYEWIQARIARNTPYNELAAGIILAVSLKPDESYDDYSTRMSSYYRKSETGSSSSGPGKANGYADQPSLTHYWTRNNFNTPDERAIGFAYSFLGVRIQCAECHKHPFDQWTKDDFDRFKTFFGRVRYGIDPDNREAEQAMLADVGLKLKGMNNKQLAEKYAELINEGKTLPFQELFVVSPEQGGPRRKDAKNANPKRPRLVSGRTAKILGGEEVRIDQLDDPRTELMEWLESEDNPYFARAFVNRVWANYFNVGIVEPPDDLSLANPPSNPELLDYLTTEFRNRGYDMKWLHREITSSRTYQLSWQPTETNRLDERNFARAVPRRLPAEVVVDAIRIATASDPEAESLMTNVENRAIASSSSGKKGRESNTGYALTVFGRSTRESNCDCDRSAEPSLLQTIFLQNDQQLLSAISRPGGWVDQVLKTNQLMQGASGVNNATNNELSGPDLERLIQRLERQVAIARKEGKLKRVENLSALLNRQRGVLDRQRRLDANETRTTGRTAASPDKPATTRLSRPVRVALEKVVRQAYLRTVSRQPDDEELEIALEYFGETQDLAVGTRDLMWALLNTKEFLVNH